jgi:F0F1-type ATP synthase membrane subunit b/b'
MNDFQTKIQDAFQQAQMKAAARAREFEQEARKVLETLSDRAQAEVKTLLAHAQTSSREQMGILGIELEKLGKKLQELAATPAGNKPPEAAHAADEKATQAPPGSVQ